MNIKLIDRCSPRLSVDASIEVLQIVQSNWYGVQKKWVSGRTRGVVIHLFEGDPYLAIVEDA